MKLLVYMNDCMDNFFKCICSLDYQPDCPQVPVINSLLGYLQTMMMNNLHVPGHILLDTEEDSERTSEHLDVSVLKTTLSTYS